MVARSGILGAAGSRHVLRDRGRELEPGELAEAATADGGATWSSTRLATVGPLTRWRDSPCWLGDYFGVSLVGSIAHVAYSSAEASPGRSHVKYRAFPAP